MRNWYDGIVFGDGTRVAIDFERRFAREGTDVTLRVGSRQWDKSWLCEVDDLWASLIPHCEVEIDSERSAECGEGSLGGDGYIALYKRDETLLWVIFLEDVNPFTRLELRGTHLVAINSHGEIWDVPIDRPESLNVASSIRGKHSI